jgi:DNA-nicking Smr family endonuclease
MEVDIHEMQVQEAKHYLERLIVNLKPNIKELVIIHGSKNGTALLNMVRKQLKSKRIKKIILSSNNGITSLIID